MFKHILVPTDGSGLSDDAVARAVEFAAETGARITFFYARANYPTQLYGEGALVDPSSPAEYDRATEIAANEILAKCEKAAASRGVNCAKRSAVSDVPWQAIIDASKDTSCDLIFMASHGRRGLSGLLLGSETQKVLTHSKIPVLVYR
jgi:nucleotide-binding universal stress UspA family protein